jgi:hypothetical protein
MALKSQLESDVRRGTNAFKFQYFYASPLDRFGRIEIGIPGELSHYTTSIDGTIFATVVRLHGHFTESSEPSLSNQSMSFKLVRKW